MHALKSVFLMLVLLAGLTLTGELLRFSWEFFLDDDGWEIITKFFGFFILAALGTLTLAENLLAHAATSTAVRKATTRAEIRREIMQEVHREATKKAFDQAMVDKKAEQRRQQMRGTMPTVQEIMASARDERDPK